MHTCAHCDFASDEPFKFCPECGAKAVEGGADPMVGRLLGRKYRVLGKLGEGSTGVVYLAEHTGLRKRVAVKVLHKELQVGDEALQRFQREGIAASQLTHPNVTQVFDFDKDEGDDALVFLAMEFVDGRDLKSWLADHGPVDAETAVDLVQQLLSTLEAAHGRGIVHRDLKPENLMLVEAEDGDRVLKVLDFGLSKLVSRPVGMSLQTLAGRVLGTPRYMAPEQWRGEDVDHRADLYAATLILYELLAGAPPFDGSDITEVMQQTTSQPPPALRERRPSQRIPDALEDIVQRGLAKAREDRFQSAAEMLDALEQLRVGVAVAPSSVRRTATGRTFARRRKSSGSRPATAARPTWPWLLGGAAVVAVLALLGWQLLAEGPGPGAGAADAPLVRLLPEDQRSGTQAQYVSLLDEAVDRLRVRDLATAKVVLEKALGMPCADAEVYLLRGRTFHQARDHDTARADYQEALARHGGYAEAAAGLGWLELDAGAADAALAAFERALALDAASAEALSGKAAVLLGRGDVDAAHPLLLDAVRADGDAALPHLWLGRVALARDDPVAAVSAFVEAKRRDSRDARALQGLGDAYFAKRETDAAIVQYEEALALEDTLPVRQRLVELLLGEERLADADKALGPALRDHGGVGDLQVLRGLIAEARDETDDAVEALRAALVREPGDPARVHELLAGLLLEQGDAAEAARQCAAAAALDEGRAGVHLTWGLALYQLADHAAAAEQLERAAALDEDNPYVCYTLGVLYMDYCEEPARARAAFERYRELGGTDPKVDGWLERLGG